MSRYRVTSSRPLLKQDDTPELETLSKVFELLSQWDRDLKEQTPPSYTESNHKPLAIVAESN